MKNSSRQDPLAEIFKQQAEDRSPTFSPLLHARIMQQIKAESIATVRSPRARMVWPALCAFAAAAAVFAFVMLRPAISTHPTKHDVAIRMPELPHIQSPIATLSQPLSNSLADARYAYLDRDATRVMRYVQDQIDVMPIRP